MNILLRLKAIDNAPLDRILTYYRVERRAEQPDPLWTLYTWRGRASRGGDRILRVSNGHRLGGLYASPEWQVGDTRRGRGYGAIALVARLKGWDVDAVHRADIVRAIADICEMRLAWVEPEAVNGLVERTDPTASITIQHLTDFSAEGLESLGCRVERLYKEESDGSRRPYLNTETHQPVYRFSWGPKFGLAMKSQTNFDPSVLQRDFGLFELKSYTTAPYIYDRIQVSDQRTATPLFPIFAIVRHARDAEDREQTWGEVYQPEWRGTIGKETERPRFYFMPKTLDWFLVGTPVNADGVALRVMRDGCPVRKAVQEGGTEEPIHDKRTVETEEEDGSRTSVESEIPDDEVRLPNLVLCHDAIDALNIYYSLNSLRLSYPHLAYLRDQYFHCTWVTRPGHDLASIDIATQLRVTEKMYVLFNIDALGSDLSYRLCRRYQKILRVALPDRLKQNFTTVRGGHPCPAEDVRSFLSAYRMTDDERLSFEGDNALMLLSLFYRALPIEPLIYRPTYDKKTGKLKSFDYKVDPACVWQLMSSQGYARNVEENSPNQIGRIIQIDRPFVRELEPESLVAETVKALKDYAQRLAIGKDDHYQKMENAIINCRDINVQKVFNLPVREVNYRSGYGPQLDHFFYKNGALRITPDEIRFVRYDRIDFCVNKAEILDFDFEIPCGVDELPFHIDENPEYTERMKALEEHKRDHEHFTGVQIQTEERELQMWAQVNHWLFTFREKDYHKWWQPLQVLRCFANEDYETEAELGRQGLLFPEEKERELEARMANILYSLGRPLFRYRGGGTNYMPYITENRNSFNDRAEGGSGKSLFVNTLMGCAGYIYKVNARNIRTDTDITLCLDGFSRFMRVVHWEDYPSGMKIDPLYNLITSAMQWRHRHKDTETLPLQDSPGHVITSNFQQTYEDPSSSGRVVPTGFSHYFNRGDVRKNKPARRVSDLMPGLRDVPGDMEIGLRSQIAMICALAVQFCMRTRDRVLPPMGDLNERSQRRALGDTFVRWAMQFFAAPYHFNCPIDITTIFNEYVEMCAASEDKQQKFARATFKNKLQEYCADNGYIMTPQVCLMNKTDREKGYMRVKCWVRKKYFDDAKVWGEEARKDIRELAQSTGAVWFCRTLEEAKELTPEAVTRRCMEYVTEPDPEPCIDPETNRPAVLTDEERQRWRAYKDRQQGQYNRPSIPAVAVDPPVKGESKEADLPF